MEELGTLLRFGFILLSVVLFADSATGGSSTILRDLLFLHHNNGSVLERSEVLLQRIKRMANSEISSERRVSLSKDVVSDDDFNQNVVVAIGVVTIICLSTVALAMCVFCRSCDDDDKVSEEGGARGYVSEINLADIQVICNPSSGAAGLPYVHHNRGFRHSQEDIILSNPAVLEVSTCDGVTVRPYQSRILQMSVAEGGNAKQPKEARRLKQLHAEHNNALQLQFENRHAEGWSDQTGRTKDRNQRLAENGKENAAPPSVTVHKSAVLPVNRSRELYHGTVTGKDYDMNDVTIKNMHVRY